MKRKFLSLLKSESFPVKFDKDQLFLTLTLINDHSILKKILKNMEIDADDYTALLMASIFRPGLANLFEVSGL